MQFTLSSGQTIDLDPEKIRALTEKDPELALRVLPLVEKAQAALASNPLFAFSPHPARNGHRPQLEFIEAKTRVVAAFAGNRFGKSTMGTVCALREALPPEHLPPLLRRTKRYDPPTAGWALVPTEDKIFDSFQPAFEKWTPKHAFKGGSWGKAYNGASKVLTFDNGSTLTFKTYKQDASTLGGAALHYVIYDEPPPKKHREECRMRLLDYGGYEMFAMTPLETNTGYVRRAIWKQREAPHITVVKGSIYDNPTLDQEAIDTALGEMSDIWRQAREFGDFVQVGGLIYPDFERCVVDDPPLDFIRSLDIIVGIDPGIRNAGFAWVGFDRDLTAYVFNEGLLQNQEAKDYAAFIHAENSRLGLENVMYASDPAQRERGKVNSTTVKTALAQHGIFAHDAQNSHEAGFDQLRSRMRNQRLFVSKSCAGLRSEADDYAAKEPGEFDDDSHLDPVSNQFHRLDALRYAVMERIWLPEMDQAPAQHTLGWKPGMAPPIEDLKFPQEALPMGFMS